MLRIWNAAICYLQVIICLLFFHLKYKNLFHFLCMQGEMQDMLVPSYFEIRQVSCHNITAQCCEFFKQNITTEKRLSIAYGCFLEAQGIQRVSVSSLQSEGLWQNKKELRLFNFMILCLSFWFSCCQIRHCNLAYPFSRIES